mmetsp:Transcript_73810/g.209025  ORF Transcript_73810/g.209025 Transcript_73810/m.209025 type:complete len:212 (+) Transcript_73810:4786-5421(+)
MRSVEARHLGRVPRTAGLPQGSSCRGWSRGSTPRSARTRGRRGPPAPRGDRGPARETRGPPSSRGGPPQKACWHLRVRSCCASSAAKCWKSTLSQQQASSGGASQRRRRAAGYRAAGCQRRCGALRGTRPRLRGRGCSCAPRPRRSAAPSGSRPSAPRWRRWWPRRPPRGHPCWRPAACPLPAAACQGLTDGCPRRRRPRTRCAAAASAAR